MVPVDAKERQSIYESAPHFLSQTAETKQMSPKKKKKLEKKVNQNLKLTLKKEVRQQQ